jgi:TonB-linked SusC/RagA family outer membrane protein
MFATRLTQNNCFMKLKLTWLLTLFMAFVMQFSFSQEKTVTGTVTTAEDGLPLPGASVIVKGTSRGQQTDFDGKYSISVNSGDVLVISYIGMKKTEVTIGASSSYDVELAIDSTLDEVVVVGYGTTTKQAFAGTVTTIATKDIENKNFANITQSLAGEASGVQVINTSGQPGSVSTVRIRGYGSISGNRSPLYVVDGIPITESETLNAINPSDIKSTSILKDATATAIYGSRGANGVILITTKTGSSTGSYIELDFKTGINTQIIPRYETITNQEENLELIWEGIRNGRMINQGESLSVASAWASENIISDSGATGVLPTRYNMWNGPGNQLINPATGEFTGVGRKWTPESFEDLVIRDGLRTEANLRLGGGDENSRYFISGGFLDDNGISQGSSYKRYTFRSNVSSQIKDWLKVGANVSYLYAEQRESTALGGSSAIFEFIDKVPTIFGAFLRDENGNKIPDILGGFVPDYGAISIGGSAPGRPASDGVSPYGNVLYDYNGFDRNEFVGSANIDLRLAKGLTFESSLSYQYRGNMFKNMSNQFYGVGAPARGELFQRNSINETTNFLQLFRYKTDWNKHSLEVLAAHESNTLNIAIQDGNKSGAEVPFGLELTQYIVNLSPAEGFQEGRTLESYFGQVNYDYDDKYYFTGSIRRDGSSVFFNNKWDTFYSLGAAWIVSNESWLESDFLRFLKLKASYGLAGDEAGVFSATGSYYVGQNLFDVTNLDGGFAVALEGNIANPNLTWERKKQYQAGVEFTLSNIVDGSFDFYVNDTENLFFNKPVNPASGSTGLLVNDGELRNMGLEFDVNFHILRNQNISMDLAVNGTHIKNELRALPENTANDFINTTFGNASVGYQVGRSIFDFYYREYAGVDPADGFPMWYEYFDDLNDNNVLDPGEEIDAASLEVHKNNNPESDNFRRQTTKEYADATQKYVGKSLLPDLQGAFRLAGNVHNFTYAMQFTYQFGGYAYDNNYREFFERGFATASGTLHADIRDRWQQPGDITNVPKLGNGSVPNDVGASDRFLIKSDYIGLNSVNIGYNLDAKSLGINGVDNINIFVSADNLFISTARQGYNPTVREAGNSGRNIYAPLSTFTCGVRMKF